MSDELARRRLIKAWRENRRAARELAEELGGFEHVVEWLNHELTYEDMLQDFRDLDIDPHAFVNYLRENPGVLGAEPPAKTASQDKLTKLPRHS